MSTNSGRVHYWYIGRIFLSRLADGYLPNKEFALEIVRSQKLTSPTIIQTLRTLADPLLESNRGYLHRGYATALAAIDGNSVESQRVLIRSLAPNVPAEIQRAAFKILRDLPGLRKEVEKDLIAAAVDTNIQHQGQAARWKTFPVRLLVHHGIKYQQSANRLKSTAQGTEHSPRPELRWALRKLSSRCGEMDLLADDQ